MEQINKKKRINHLIFWVLILTVISGELLKAKNEILANTFMMIHIIAGIFCILLVITHIIQHWKYIKGIIRKKKFMNNKTVPILLPVFFGLSISGVTLLIVGYEYEPFVKIHNLLAYIFIVFSLIHLFISGRSRPSSRHGG